MPVAAIGIGSNVGDAAQHVREAIERLAELGTVAARSALYRSAPWGVTDQAAFVNAAALVDTPLDPRALLDALKTIEADAGRVATFRWGPRVLDLDILAYGDRRIDEPDLIVPHARLRERAFVLVPLAEIDERYVPLRDALSPGDRADVVELSAR
ncbi:MAG: 2-amino-4-hydroxy-6-hydroxymethyldihydropteridine diphosphokinase [Candidatus Elarobacter sp.]